MEELKLDKEQILELLRNECVNILDIDVMDIEAIGNQNGFSYQIIGTYFINGQKLLRFLPISRRNFCRLLRRQLGRVYVEQSNEYYSPFIQFSSDDPFSIVVSYNLTENYGRRRRKK